MRDLFKWEERHPPPPAPGGPPPRPRRLGDVTPGQFFITVTLAVGLGVLVALYVAYRLGWFSFGITH